MKATTTKMSRVVIDLPASVPLIDLHRLAERHQCRIVRRPDGSLRFQPTKQRGFIDLISLMTAVAVIGILATIALPSMFDTLMRQSVQKGIEYVEPLQELVVANHAEGLPLDEGFSPVSAPMRRLEQISIDADTGTILLEWRHGTVAVEPQNLGEPLTVWRCDGGTLEQRFRPAACREG